MRAVRRVGTWFRSVGGRLFVSHVLVATLTPLLIALFLAIATATFTTSFTPADYATFAEDVAILWLMPESDAAELIRNNRSTNFTPPGYALVVSPDERVVFADRDAPCAVGTLLADCAPHFAGQAAGETFTEIDGERWIDMVLPLNTGDRVYAQFAAPTSANIGGWLVRALPEILVALVQIALIVSAASIPISAVLVVVFARPLLRRIAQVAAISQQFADGDLNARVLDPYHDEVSRLARQFDSMADVLQQNIFTLRDLLKSNAQLMIQAEETAVQSERLRLARDLHDDLAQQLFSLSMSSAGLSNLLEQHNSTGADEAKQVARLAEKTLLGLRALLIELRPGGLLERGLAGGLKLLCEDWQKQQQVDVDLSIMLATDWFSAPLQIAVHQIVRESLNNIARHAHATQVTISVLEGRNQLVVSISDNGLGVRPDDMQKEGHFGMVSMRERAESLGGTLFIESERKQGTTIRAVLPLVRSETLMPPATDLTPI